MLTNELIENILKNTAFPTHTERPDFFVMWLGHTQANGYGPVHVNDAAIPATGVRDRKDLYFVIEQAIRLGFVDGKVMHGALGIEAFGPLRLTLSGWTRYEALEKGSAPMRQAFMAMKFGDPETDALFKDCFKVAVKAAGFELKRLDEEPRAGLIDDRLRVEIRQSRFLIADLTHANPGAYWEAGFAEGLDKPVIFTCRKDVFDNPNTRPHFDTNHHLTVVWDPAALREAVDQLKATIRATLPGEAKLTD